MPIQEFTVNVDAWKKLPDDLKALLHTAVREWTWDQTQRIAVDDLRVVRELAAKGIKASQWPEPEMVKIRALAQRTWEEWSKKTPLAKQAYDSQLAWLKELGVVA
jgi:TRAP-type mannitol/chloroaromatic compound transport system substrate-binding protein